jgi:PAS domain S-box-containing protein
MEVQPETQHAILESITAIGTSGATITEIEKRVSFERHTLSKYLSFMQAQGFIYHKAFGKAKVWFINKAPLQTVLNSLPEQRSFTERVLSGVLKALPYGLFVVDRDYSILFLNDHMKRTYGDVEAEKFYEHVLGRTDPMTIKPITEVLRGNQVTGEVEVEDIGQAMLRIRATPLTNPDSSSSYILMVEDITKRKVAELEVQAQRNILQAEREALNKSAILAETDVGGRITYVNDKFVELSGYSRNELIGKTHAVVNSNFHSKAFFGRLWKKISSGSVWHGKIKNKAKNGKCYWTDTTISPVLDANGVTIKYLSIRYVHG